MPKGGIGIVSKELRLLYSAAGTGCTLGRLYRKRSDRYSTDSGIPSRRGHLPRYTNQDSRLYLDHKVWTKIKAVYHVSGKNPKQSWSRFSVNRVLPSFGLYRLVDGTVFKMNTPFHFMGGFFFLQIFACNRHWSSEIRPVLSEAIEVN